jgi:dTDP-4-amino-4,6-dideoxygalactose transaminase
MNNFRARRHPDRGGEHPPRLSSVRHPPSTARCLDAVPEGHGISTAIHYPAPIHAQPAYRGRLGDVGSLPDTEQAAQEIVSLPMYPELSEQDVKTVARAIREFVAQ